MHVDPRRSKKFNGFTCTKQLILYILQGEETVVLLKEGSDRKLYCNRWIEEEFYEYSIIYIRRFVQPQCKIHESESDI
ncbi:hypothetical protein Hamer_G005106 [Homarus americanus]|uniref:Uncharacterized protein n=1 Tax=Homarus americanus TaxID=6706 RepID=A0A8J5MV30_HOMAM|nr:hypothetical protein Hamer_G005106 [Homarus americanus]